MLIIIIAFLICLQLTYWYPDSLQVWSVCCGIVILFVLLTKFIKAMFGYCPKCRKFLALETVSRTLRDFHYVTEKELKSAYDPVRRQSYSYTDEKKVPEKVYDVVEECRFCHEYRKYRTEYER